MPKISLMMSSMCPLCLNENTVPSEILSDNNMMDIIYPIARCPSSFISIKDPINMTFEFRNQSDFGEYFGEDHTSTELAENLYCHDHFDAYKDIEDYLDDFDFDTVVFKNKQQLKMYNSKYTCNLKNSKAPPKIEYNIETPEGIELQHIIQGAFTLNLFNPYISNWYIIDEEKTTDTCLYLEVHQDECSCSYNHDAINKLLIKID